MLEPLFTDFASSLPTILAGWNIPIAYLILCILVGCLQRSRAEKLPEHADPWPHVPSLHPVLLSALWFHNEGASQTCHNTLCAALAGIVNLIGTGTLVCTETAIPPSEGNDPSPFTVRGRRREHVTAHDLAARAAGAAIALEQHAAGVLVESDVRTLELFMPAGMQRTSVADICRLPRTRTETYRRIKDFLAPCEEELVSRGLVRRAGAFVRIAFSPAVTFFAAAACIFEPIVVLGTPDASLAPFAVIFLITIMLCAALAVDRGPALTPEGARILSDALGTVAWGEALAGPDDELSPRSPREADIPGLLAALFAMGRPDLATALATRIASRSHQATPSSKRDTADCARSAVLFCAQRSLRTPRGDEAERSPAQLIFDELERCCDNVES